ncbi:MAG: type IV-A pilus assembly ATPase PilB, partial [Gammaproteobacteria bacterium]
RPLEIPKDALIQVGFSERDVEQGFTVYEAAGCDQCNKGYKGRVGLYQVMPISDAMRRLIMEGVNAVALADRAEKEGIPDIRQSALKKVKDGITSMEEINRVTLD